jgi:hypothetical protein
MSSETTTQDDEITQAAWSAFQYWTGRRDDAHFRRAYLGHYPDRAAFGQELARQLGAEARLARLPDWLRAYLRIDGEALLHDFEQAGHFWVYELPDSGGAFVFDAYERPDDEAL